MIADIGITVPSDIVDDVYISMVALTESLVSVSISTATQGLLVGTFPAPITPLEVLPLSPVADNVSGFVVFGSYVKQSLREAYVFSGVVSSKLSERAARPFDPLPISSISKLNGDPDQKLTGMVNIEVDDNMKISTDGSTITLELAEDVQSDFVGPCDGTSEFLSCGLPPIRTINGVGPDIDGKVLLEVE